MLYNCRNGKNVTVVENEHFMSIFKYAGQGSDSVEEQFYEEEDNEIPNMRFNIWTDVLMNYVRLVGMVDGLKFWTLVALQKGLDQAPRL